MGVDVGGTNIKLGLVRKAGRIIARTCLETKVYARHPAKLIQAMAEGIASLLRQNGFKKQNVQGVGIGLPGLVDPVKGHVIFLPNIPGWKNIPLRKHLEKKVGLEVFLDNDVNVMTLGEWRFGAGQGSDDMIGMTLGTGVGAGLILGGALYRGPGFGAGELGHIPVNLTGPKCSCPSFACLETYVGNGPLQRRAAKIFRHPGITLEEVFALAKQGNQKALGFWEEAGEYVGTALVGVVNVLNPTKIVIGGGVANTARFLFPAIRRQIKGRAMPVQAKMARVVRAKLGDDAGLVGSRVLVETEQNIK